jgi:hypothetical protein
MPASFLVFVWIVDFEQGTRERLMLITDRRIFLSVGLGSRALSSIR